jgi:hypothetical protein
MGETLGEVLASCRRAGIPCPGRCVVLQPCEQLSGGCQEAGLSEGNLYITH